MDNHFNDALRHLQKDMEALLPLLAKPNTTELILNPYKQANGYYVGQVLIAGHNMPLTNVIQHNQAPLINPKVVLGDTIIYKYHPDNPQKILFWITWQANQTNQANSFYARLTLLVLSIIEDNIAYQTQDKHLLYLTNQLSLGYLNNTIIENKYLEITEELIQLLNDNFASSLRWKYASLTLSSSQDILSLPQYPMTITNSSFMQLTSTKVQTIMSVLASITGNFLHHKNPKLECSIPYYGYRFSGVLPPVTNFPSFCIRKHSPKIFTLDDFVNQDILSATSKDTIISWIKRKFNILIAGGTGSGKTTLANAILYEIAQLFPDERIIIIEDVPELQFSTNRSIAFNINEFFSMSDALRLTLRFNPNRIVMGEVRGAEAYTLLKAWNTGHPGGLATIHANGVNEAVYRFENCIQDHPNVKVNRQELGFTLNGIISIQNIMQRQQLDNGDFQNIVKRKVTALRQIIAYDSDKDIYQDIIYDKVNESFD